MPKLWIGDKMYSVESEVRDEVDRLQAKVDKAQKQILEYEETEALICPEDIGIKEYVEQLQEEINKLKQLTGIPDTLYELGEERRRNEQLQAKLDKHRWIPVTERLPEDSEEYLWYCNIPDNEILLFGDRELFHESDYNLTHYLPIILPEQALKGE